MAEYDPRPELIAMQQSLLKEYKCQLSKEIEENVALLSHLSQREQAGERVPHEQIQQALGREKQNASELVALKFSMRSYSVWPKNTTTNWEHVHNPAEQILRVRQRMMS